MDIHFIQKHATYLSYLSYRVGTVASLSFGSAHSIILLIVLSLLCMFNEQIKRKHFLAKLLLKDSLLLSIEGSKQRNAMEY